MSKILHNHKPPDNEIFRPECPRCKLNYAALDLLATLKRAYFLIETHNIQDNYFEVLRLEVADLLPKQTGDTELLAKAIADTG